MITELAFFVYSVRDVARARSFYVDVMGLRQGEVSNDEFVEFDLGNVAFAIDATGAMLGMPPGASTGAAFEVEEIDAARRRLLEYGVEVTEIYEFAPCRMCYARDPDGNRFALHERKR